MLVLGPTDLIRPAENGWDVIWSSKPECLPAAITHTLWSVASSGAIARVESYVEPADPDADEVCA
jgi:hypothetical protein